MKTNKVITGSEAPEKGPQSSRVVLSRDEISFGCNCGMFYSELKLYCKQFFNFKMVLSFVHIL